MWFKNLIVYQFEDIAEFDADTLSMHLEKDRFSRCGPQDLTSMGWAAPMGESFDALVHSGSAVFLLTARREERVLPTTVVNEALSEKVLEIELKEDRKVGRKQKMEIKDELIFSMTPRAFTRSTWIKGLIMPEQKLLVIDSSSRPRAEDWLTLLRQSLGSLDVKPLETKHSLPSVFTEWLNGKTAVPSRLTLGEECLLQSPDDSRANVHLRGQDLTGDEVATHLAAGKYATRLELHWKDSHSFVLNEAAEIKRFSFSDTIIEQAHIDGAGDSASEFDAAFTLMSLALSSFLPRLWEVLGGLRDVET